MSRLRPWLLIAVIAVLSAWFAAANGGQRVSLQLGLFTLHSISVPALVFGSVILGMVIVMLAGLSADLRTRAMIRRYRELLGKND